MEETRERLSKVIKDSNLPYSELEKLTGIAKSSLQRYATGTTKKIPIEAVQKIAKATNSSAAWIMGWDDIDEETEKKNDILSDIILRASIDEELFELIQLVSDIPLEQRGAVKSILSALRSTK